MVIKGLGRVQEAPVDYRALVSERAAISVQALMELGLVLDADEALETITGDYADLLQETSFMPGRLFVDVPYSKISTEELTIKADGKNNYPELWVPGQNKGGYSHAELAKTSTVDFAARLALHNLDKSNGHHLLHFLGMPFDEEYAQKGKPTQLQSIAQLTAKYNISHPQLDVAALGHRAIAVITLEQQIKDAPLPLMRGFMRDGSLPRKMVDGESFVGCVGSNGAQLLFDGDYGIAGPDGGVGVSVGQKTT